MILLFTFLGEHLLNALKIKQEATLVAGGIILFVIALHMIFPTSHEVYGSMKKEPLIVPLAIPLIADPSTLAAAMIYSHQVPFWTLVGGIGLAWLLSTIILISAPFLKKILGDWIILASERLMGFLLTLLAVRMILDGVFLFVSPCP